MEEEQAVGVNKANLVDIGNGGDDNGGIRLIAFLQKFVFKKFFVSKKLFFL